MRKSLIIIFPDEWLSHSPTVLNIKKSLSDVFDIRIFAIDDGMFRNHSLCGDEYIFIKINKLLSRFFLRKFRSLYDVIKAKRLKKAVTEYVKSNKADRVIGVDSVGLWVAQQVFGKSHFLSLEVKKDRFFRSIDICRIESVIIQTEERYNYLFDKSLSHKFFIQNSPPFSKSKDVTKISFQKKLIFFGTVMPSHGLYACLNTLEHIVKSDDGYRLTIKGVIPKKWVRSSIMVRYRSLIEKNIITIDEQYTDQDEIIPYLSNFDIGFCLYDFRLISKNDFNYLSVPSGKLFNFYASGVPVIGVNIPGLNSVREFQTGILLENLSVDAIKNAILKISEDYAFFSTNCLKAAEHFDFQKAAQTYKEFLSAD
jgi:glycosyltransferase involved in cell wall biosynthesis